MDHVKRLQEWVNESLGKRATALQHEAIFYIFLVEGEQGACPWQQTGYASFDEVLRKYHIADALRYRRFYSATLSVEKGAELSKKIGIDAVIVGSGIADADLRKMFIDKIKELTAVRPASAPLTLEEIRKLRRDIAPQVRQRTDKPTSIGIPKQLQSELEALVVELRKTGGAAHATALAQQFIRDGIARCRKELLKQAEAAE